MPQIGIRSLRDEASRIVHRAQAGERFVVTRHNRPAALLIGISEARDFVFTHAEDFVMLREEGRGELAVAAGAGARTRRAVALSPGAAVRIARLRGSARGRVDAELRRLAACLRAGDTPVKGLARRFGCATAVARSCGCAWLGNGLPARRSPAGGWA
jgi:prevent-host-death family protein